MKSLLRFHVAWLFLGAFCLTQSTLNGQTVGPYSVSGRAIDGTIGVSNVTVIASNLTVTADSRSGVTDTNGNYTIAGLGVGTYAVMALKTNTVFNPAAWQVDFPTTNNATVVSNLNFVVVYNLSGRLTNALAGTTGISDVTVVVRIMK